MTPSNLEGERLKGIVLRVRGVSRRGDKENEKTKDGRGCTLNGMGRLPILGGLDREKGGNTFV